MPTTENIEQDMEWIELGNSNLTQLMSLQNEATSVKTGAYVVLKYECNGIDVSLCKKMKMHLISCYTDSLVDPANFDYDASLWYQDSIHLVLEEGPFSLNCEYHSTLQGGRECF